MGGMGSTLAYLRPTAHSAESIMTRNMPSTMVIITNTAMGSAKLSIKSMMDSANQPKLNVYSGGSSPSATPR